MEIDEKDKMFYYIGFFMGMAQINPTVIPMGVFNLKDKFKIDIEEIYKTIIKLRDWANEEMDKKSLASPTIKELEDIIKIGEKILREDALNVKLPYIL